MKSGVYEVPTAKQRNIITLFDFLKQAEQALGVQKPLATSESDHPEAVYDTYLRTFVEEVWHRLHRRLGVLVVINRQQVERPLSIEEASAQSEVLLAESMFGEENVIDLFFNGYRANVMNTLQRTFAQISQDPQALENLIETQKALNDKIKEVPHGEHPLVIHSIEAGLEHALKVCKKYLQTGWEKLNSQNLSQNDRSIYWNQQLVVMRPAILRQAQTHCIIDVWLDALYQQGADLLIEPSSDVRLRLPANILITDREQVRTALCTVARQAVSSDQEASNLLSKPRIRCPAAQVPHAYPATKELFDQVAVDFTHFMFGNKECS